MFKNFELTIPLIIFILVTASQAFGQDEDLYSISEVRDHIRWFHKNVNQKRMKKALKLAPIVIKYAEQYNQDHMMISTIISLESSWRTGAAGDLKEEGLMQVMPGGPCSKGLDMSTPAGQIEAGVKCLVLAREKCGDDPYKIFTKYATGWTCKSKSKITQRKMRYRVKYYERAVKRHRIERPSNENNLQL